MTEHQQQPPDDARPDGSTGAEEERHSAGDQSEGPDYARGERQKPPPAVEPDFARGQRDDPASQGVNEAIPDFARGEPGHEDLPASERPKPDFARGQDGDPERGMEADNE
ncbi:MAG: hypothetical protein U0Y82_06040 [Thermoleophilia bacterium]